MGYCCFVFIKTRKNNKKY